MSTTMSLNNYIYPIDKHYLHDLKKNVYTFLLIPIKLYSLNTAILFYFLADKEARAYRCYQT